MIGLHLTEWYLSSHWANGPVMPGLQQCTFRRLDADAAIAGNPVASIDFSRQYPGTYIHALQADERLFADISQQTKDAFGIGLVINWGLLGQTLPPCRHRTTLVA